ncbi:sigma-70 family RNA polymerase sigma factor [Pseudonocardia sp.]|uniref:sigma-70 family RNA polymerase sigma factor n=1 Tax=Pseudonocardia sp. TaxID=60912 RepID=UPI003D0F2750
MNDIGTTGLALAFEDNRTHLLAVAYRLTGSWADAEDAVQEAWLRLHRAGERAGIRDLRAWLTVAVGRLCLDRLRSAPVRRERHVGPWLPEPVVTDLDDGDGPAAAVVRDEGVRMAALVVLERLTPDQRVAFVLHDAFDVPFAEIAGLLGCSPAAARQHASRARRIVADADPPPRAALADQQKILAEFAAAIAGGDLEAVVRLLHPDAVLIGDGGGVESTARRPIVGPDRIARFLLGLQRKYGDTAGDGRPVLVNGDLGLVVPATAATARRVVTLSVRDGLVAAVYDVVDPGKLTRVP